jgi:hypothetical protein
MKRSYFCGLVFVVWTVTCSIRPNPTPRGVFASKVCLQGNGEVYMLFAFLDNGVTLSHKKILNKDEFTKFASGYWPSIYNPERRNYFKENKLDCGVIENHEFNQKLPYCSPIDSLWKISYSMYPYTNNNDKGWSKELYKPSDRQAVYLMERYGIISLETSYFIDDKFWLLLKDMQDPSWVLMYKSL